MKIITHVLKVLWAYWYFFIFALIFLILYPAFAITLSRERWWKYANRLRIVWGYFLFPLTGIIPQIRYERKLSKQRNYIFCSNHFSYFDIPMSAMAAQRNWRFMAKEELGSLPILNIFFKSIDILINRENARESLKALREAGESLKKGMSIVVYPEGMIGPNPPKLLRFKSGPFKLAIEHQVPIVPVTMADNWKILFVDGWKASGRPGIARVFVHSPIETKGMTADDVESLKQKVHRIIEQQLKTYEH
ncbi:MAG TPA: lysophospholipid acyltransferase family protein [Chitinophagales bacterium]|nr:lysophospholipid acyltransferase family protein [Chitinophagales bacterium]